MCKTRTAKKTEIISYYIKNLKLHTVAIVIITIVVAVIIVETTIRVSEIKKIKRISKSESNLPTI